MHKREPLARFDIVGRNLHNLVVDRLSFVLLPKRPVNVGGALERGHGVFELTRFALQFGHAHQIVNTFVEMPAPQQHASVACSQRDVAGRQA